MALELMARIMSQPRDVLDASEKLVLMVMADRADSDGLLWYSVNTIAYLTSYTRKAVQNIINRLVTKGFVKKLQRTDRSNYYVIQVDRLPLRERVKRPKEIGPREFVAGLEAEPDLFGTGERATPPGANDVPGRANDVPPAGERATPDSLNDSLIDPPESAQAHEGLTIHDFVLSGWNAIAEKHEALPPIRFLSDERKRLIDLRTEEHLHDQDWNSIPPERGVWRHVFDQVDGSKLLTGQKTDWYPSIDWVLKRANFAKIMEGNYGRGNDSTTRSATGAAGRSAVAAGTEARRLVDGARSRRRAHASGADGREGRSAGFGSGR